MNDASTRPDVFGLIFLLSQHMTRRADEALAPLGLTTSQWLLLAVVSRCTSPPTLTEAAAAYGSSRQNVKQVARALELRGFLALRADTDDARAVRLHLLPRVAEAFDTPEAVARQTAFFESLFAPLSAEEQRQLRAILTRWVGSL